MPSIASLCSRAVLLVSLALSGCFSFGGRGNDHGSEYDCSLGLRTSGAVTSTVEHVEGCSVGGSTVGEQSSIHMGAFPRDSRPFDYVELTFYEALEDSGEGAAVDVELVIDDARRWRAPKGACTADYVAEPCSAELVEDGVRYIVTDVECADPALSDNAEPIVIEVLRLTSSCAERSYF